MNRRAYNITQSTMKAIAAGAIRADGVRECEEFYRRHISRQLEQLDLTSLHIVLSLVDSFRGSQHWRNV